MRQNIATSLKAALLAATCAGSVLLTVGIRDTQPVQVPLEEPDADVSLQQSAKATAVKFVAAQLKRHRETTLLRSDLNEQALIARFLNNATPLEIRKLDAWRLAVSGSKAAKAALLSVLRNGSPQMRGIVAEMLGRGRWPEAVDILAGLFAERDEVVARGAVAGLILLGDDKAVAVLREVLLDDTMSPVLRALIAQRLGEVRSLASLEALQAALAINLLPEDVMHGVLDSLGKFPFQRTQALYRQLIANESVDTETKAAAAESLIDAGKSALPFLTDTAAKAASSEVRAAAAWTAGAHPDTGKLAPQLSAMLQSENDAEVRRRLYEALMRQEQIPATELLQQALTESDPATRIAAANMLAMALNQSAQNGDLQHNFDTQAVPELVAAALGDGSLNLRYRAVFALVRAQTDAAQSALQTIKQYGEPQIAALAGRNLER